MYGRQRRSLVDVGGKFAKFVFGTMDSEDSQKIYENLQVLGNRQATIQKIQNQHIAILQSNFDALSKPIEQLQNTTYEIEDKLNQLIQQGNDQKEEEVKREKLDHQIAELISITIVQCLHIKSLQEEATEIIVALDNKILHPLLVPYSKVVEIMKKQPIEINEKMLLHKTIRKITDIEYTELGDKLVVKITIPLARKDTYNLFKPHLLPFETKQGYRTYLIDTEYIALNNESGKTIELSLREIEKCRTISSDEQFSTQLCQDSQPIQPITNKHCLQTLLTEHFELKEQCTTLPTNSMNTFIKLEHHNSWLFTLTKPTDIVIQCKNTTESLRIEKVGIISFKERCRIITEDFTSEVTGQQITVEIVQPEAQRDTDVQDINTLLNDRQNQSKTVKVTPLKLLNSNDNKKRILDEARKIDELKTMAKELNQNITPNHIGATIQTVITTTSVIAVAAILTILVYSKKCKGARNKPTTINVINAEQTTEAKNTKTKTEDDQQNMRSIRVI